MRIAFLVSLTLACAAVRVGAAENEQLAVWRAGGGAIAGQAAHPSDAIVAKQAVVAAKDPARVEFAKPATGSLTLSPGAEVSLEVESAAGGKSLVVQVEQGAIQVDLSDKGSYSDVRVRSGQLEVRVVGTCSSSSE
jgi:hypothetical protein